jgi:hypothetical protein
VCSVDEQTIGVAAKIDPTDALPIRRGENAKFGGAATKAIGKLPLASFKAQFAIRFPVRPSITTIAPAFETYSCAFAQH